MPWGSLSDKRVSAWYRQPVVWTAFALLLLGWAYWPGLSGPFLFDDYANLDVLGAYGRIHDLRTLLFYLTSGTADPLGRPLSLLTFLLDAHDWPASPWAFKRTNLLLHLLNTALLALTVARLQAGYARAHPGARTPSRWTPLAAALLWGAHPFFVSTTLYVVQREAMLPATFVLLALLAWDRAVLRFAEGRTLRAWAWATLGLGGFTALGTLSKANGALAPLLAGVAWLTVLRPDAASPARSATDRAAWACLAVPSALIVAYLGYVGWQHAGFARIPGRDWSLAERLISEPRVLWHYLWRLALPRAGTGGLYADAFPASRSLLAPWTTLPALLALAAVTIVAMLARRRAPIACFAWCFFVAGHLMESTTVPLELYFEHRNYVPALFLGWPIADALLRPGAYPRYRATAIGLLLLALLLLTQQRALTWSSARTINAVAARADAASPRAQYFAALDADTPAMALARLQQAQRLDPNSVDLAIGAISVECGSTGRVDATTLAKAKRTLATARAWNYRLAQWLQDAPSSPGLRNCIGLGLPGLAALLDAAQANPNESGINRRRDLLSARGRLALADRNPELALRWFDAVLAVRPDPDYALVQAAALGDVGAPALGVRHLDHFLALDTAPPAPVRDMPSLHAWLLRHYGYYRTELASLRARLQAASVTTPPSTSPR